MGKKILTIYIHGYKISLSGSMSFKYMYAFHIVERNLFRRK